MSDTVNASATAAEVLDAVVTAVNAGDNARVLELVDPTFHSGNQHPMYENRDEYFQTMASMRAAFSDWQQETLQTVAEGDLVVQRMLTRARHTGVFRGVEPTGKEVEFEAFAMIQAADGRLVQSWLLHDHLTILRQLGVVEMSDRLGTQYG